MKFIKVILASVLVLGLMTPVMAKNTYSVEDFFRNARYSNMQVSPNGKYLAAIAPAKNRRNIANGFQPMAFDYDNQTLFVSSGKDHDTTAVYRYNPNTREFGGLVFHHDAVDAGGLIMSDKREKLLAATYYTDKPAWQGIDDEFTRMMKSLEASFPNQMVNISSLNKEEDLAIVTVGSDVAPTQYYMFDIDNKKMEHLADSMDWIDPADMSERRPISYTSRDGLTIHGYLTVPKGSNGKDLPLIINPHGGPWARDTWGFNVEHQFFANRGYAVLQMNFRGSTGYGRKHLEIAYKQWGKTMQDDISDAVKWAVAEGIADEDRVCIYGGSYGGYATMAGMTSTPELYKCGINYVGVTDIALLFETMPKRWNLGAEQMKQQVGDPKTESEMLAQASPLNHVENIKAPIFIVHGRKDPRVNIKHATLLRKEMDKHNKAYEWMVKNNEGHGFRKEENRIELYTAMGEFFDKYIGEHGSSGP